MQHNYQLKGQKINLRPLFEADLETVRNWRNNQKNRASFINQSIINSQQQIAWYANYLIKFNDIMFIIEENESNVPIGTVSIYNIDLDSCQAEFGRLMIGDSKANGKGFGLEATHLSCDFAFNELELQSVYLQVFKQNKRAIHIYEKCGFQIFGEVNVGDAEMLEMKIEKGSVVI